MDTTIYICADGTLTYGPLGGKDKIIKEALPVGFAPSEHIAQLCIATMGKRAYDVPENDAHFEGRTIKEGYGPNYRFFYSGPEFVRNDVNSLSDVMNRFEELIKRFAAVA